MNSRTGFPDNLFQLRFLFLFGAMLFCGTVAAQSVEPAGYGDSNNTGRAAGDVIQPFDQIDLRVKRDNQLSDIYTVSPTGYINLPLLGAIQASGMTPAQLETDLTQLLTAYIRKPEVTVTLLSVDRGSTSEAAASPVQVGAYSVYITGAVREPGVYYLREPTNPFQLIVRAGGTDNLVASISQRGELSVFPDLKNVSVVNAGGTARFLDLSQVGQNEMALDFLKPGDTVIVPGYRAGTFSIYGEIADPDIYEIPQPVLITDALAMAGGILRYSDLRKINLLRGNSK
ncbi:MAG: polysaccharide biosynthesis/export family protein, partial [Candidatus Omnitrophica bacterium]|nr:polysaccharide biosynthesis/export family protein [Candidatus Omnitrophota bacterium]